MAAAKIEQIDHVWAERRESIAPEAFDKELRGEWRERTKFAESQALSVVAGYVELLAGTPREIEEAREASGRSSFQSRQRRVVEAAPAAPGAVEVEQQGAPAEQPAPHAAQEPDAPADVEQAPPPVAEPVKPRRREPPAVAQVVPASEEDGEPVGAEVEPAGVEGNGNGHLVQK